MTSPTVDRRFGLVGNAALKAPVAAIATTNITLSGQQTIDGVALLAVNASGVPDRVLVTGQTTASQNGIYDVSTAAWSRAADADGPYDFARGSMVLVNGGTTNATTVWMLTTAGAITIGTTSLTWQIAIGASMLSAVLAAQTSATNSASSAAASSFSEAQAAAIVLGNFLQTGVGARARTFTSKDRDWVSVMDFGAIGDGTSHPLSERYASLAAAQVDFPFVTSLAQSIDYAAFQAAHNALASGAVGTADERTRGDVLRVPPGKYYLSDTWAISKRMHIMGSHSGDQKENAASILYFPADTTGLRLYSFIDSPNGQAADRTRISGLNINASAKNATGKGIYATCITYVEDCVIRGFQGYGIHFNGQTGVTGNADGWNVRRTKIATCTGGGLRVEGGDSQVGLAELVDVSGCLGYHYYDNAFYANTYISCHSDGVGTASYYCRNGVGQGSTYIDCYVEYGQVGSLADFDGNVIVINGALSLEAFTGNVIYGGSAGFTFNAPTGNTFLYYVNGVEIGRIKPTGQLSFPGGLIFASGAGDSVNLNTGSALWKTGTGTTAANALVFQNGNGTVGTIQTNASATAYNTSSDYRLKANVHPMTGALAKVMQLKPCTFTWKVDGAPGQGFIAHELQAVVPDCVSGEKDATEQVDVKDAHGNVIGTEIVPKHQGVDASFLVATLAAALQELKTDFDAYKAAHP